MSSCSAEAMRSDCAAGLRELSCSINMSGVASMPSFSSRWSASASSMTKVFASGECKRTSFTSYEKPFFRSWSVGEVYAGISMRGVHWRAAMEETRIILFCS